MNEEVSRKGLSAAHRQGWDDLMNVTHKTWAIYMWTNMMGIVCDGIVCMGMDMARISQHYTNRSGSTQMPGHPSAAACLDFVLAESDIVCAALAHALESQHLLFSPSICGDDSGISLACLACASHILVNHLSKTKLT